jgi:hypothetical protein
MEITVKLISQINSATKPLACDCFDLRGRTRSIALSVMAKEE